jgi:hypothetical protein
MLNKTCMMVADEAPIFTFIGLALWMIGMIIAHTCVTQGPMHVLGLELGHDEFMNLSFLTAAVMAAAQLVPNKHMLFATIQNVPHNKLAVYVDSGCSKSVFSHARKLINVRTPERTYRVIGVGGQIEVTEVGDFPLAMRDNKGNTTVVLIKDCLVAPDAFTNLLAVTDITEAGIGFEVLANLQTARLTYKRDSGTVHFQLQNENGLYKLPFYKDVMTHFAGVCSHQLRALTEQELWHRRLGHAGAKKLAHLSKNCIGMSPLPERDITCHCCMEGKAKRQDYPPPSSN